MMPKTNLDGGSFGTVNIAFGKCKMCVCSFGVHELWRFQSRFASCPEEKVLKMCFHV
jgi:hypothetical protein